MGDDQIQELEDQKKEKVKNTKETLPPCKIAPSAEQARAHDDGEPCDDGVTG